MTTQTASLPCPSPRLDEHNAAHPASFHFPSQMGGPTAWSGSSTEDDPVHILELTGQDVAAVEAALESFNS